VATSHPPIPEPTTQLPRTSSYIDYSALPYSQVYVHFPPSPTLTSTHVVDPPRLYDRSPIVVAENSCAMPQRGCPGRTYATIDGVGRGAIATGNALALSSRAKFSLAPPSPTRVPPLMPDEHGSGSSSDDSDAISPFPEPIDGLRSFCHALCLPGQHAPTCRAALHTRPSPRDLDPSTQFLPHPHVSSRSSKPSLNMKRQHSSTSRIGSAFVSNWDNSSCLEGF